MIIDANIPVLVQNLVALGHAWWSHLQRVLHEASEAPSCDSSG